MTEAKHRMGVAGRTILLAGATSASGLAVARALAFAGARVVATGRSSQRLSELAEAVPGIRTEVCDVTDAVATASLAEKLGPIDGLIPLIGGWRGGGGLAGQSDEDYRVLEASFTAIRVSSRAFDAALRASPAGRFAIVSSTAVTRPLAGGANYASVKAASETWTRAVAQGFAKAAREAGKPLQAASVVFRAKTLDPESLARAVVGLWDADASELNDRVIDLDA